MFGELMIMKLKTVEHGHIAIHGIIRDGHNEIKHQKVH